MPSLMSFIDFFRLLEKRPGMYLGATSLERLNLYIMGWEHAESSFKELKLLYQFSDWLSKHEKYGNTSRSGTFVWSHAISKHAKDDKSGLYDFFDLFNQFLIWKAVHDEEPSNDP